MRKLLVGLIAVVFCMTLILGCDENKTLGAVVEVDSSRPLLNHIGGEHLWVGKILQSSDDCSEEADSLDLAGPNITLSLRILQYRYGGFRFDDADMITIADTDSAFFKISPTKRTCFIAGGCNFFIYGVKEEDPATWSSTQLPSGVTPTIDTVFAVVMDNAGAELSECLPQQTYDVTEILRELTTFDIGYDSGEAVSLVLEREGFCNNCILNWQSYDFVPDSGSAGDCSAILEVYYSRP